MPVSLDLRTLFLIFSVTCSRFNIQTSRNTWLVSSPCIPTTIALGPRRVHLVSRVSTVRSPFPIDRAGIFYCISFAAFIGPAISHPIPIRSRSVGHLRSVYVSFSFFSLAVSPTRRDLSISHFSRACGSGKREGIVFVYLS